MQTGTTSPKTTPKSSIWVSGLIVLTGIWLIIAPFVLHIAHREARLNSIAVGVVIAAFALFRAFVPTFGTAWLSWLNALAGIWLIIGSFVLDYAGRARTHDIIFGILVLLLGLGSVALSEQDQPTMLR